MRACDEELPASFGCDVYVGVGERAEGASLEAGPLDVRIDNINKDGSSVENFSIEEMVKRNFL